MKVIMRPGLSFRIFFAAKQIYFDFLSYFRSNFKSSTLRGTSEFLFQVEQSGVILFFFSLCFGSNWAGFAQKNWVKKALFHTYSSCTSMCGVQRKGGPNCWNIPARNEPCQAGAVPSCVPPLQGHTPALRCIKIGFTPWVENVSLTSCV